MSGGHLSNGLNSEQVEKLLKEVGPNTIKSQSKKSILAKLIEQLADFLVVILLTAAGISFYLGHAVDGGLILTIVVLNAFFGLYQEQKAEDAIELLKKMSITKTRVIRDGKETEIESTLLVPGDIAIVDEGSKVPADGVVLETKHFEVDESALTGESLAVTKTVEERMFMGTLATKGRAVMKIEQTGMSTEFGKITARLSVIDKIKSPLQKKLETLSRMVGIAGIIISAGVFLISVAAGLPHYQAFLLAVSLAVAVVPEGLPAIMTITLAIGTKEMAKRNAIVRKLSSIEALGNITLIATDKTGTITSNKMKAEKVYTGGETYEVTSLAKEKDKVFDQIVLNGILCSTSSLDGDKVLGDPTEGALLLMARDHGTDYEKVRNSWQILDESAFDSKTKRMGVQAKRAGQVTTFIKGAPESIIALSTTIQTADGSLPFTQKQKKDAQSFIDVWGGQGYRILAFAQEKQKKQGKVSFSDTFAFLGLVAIRDPLRPEVKEALVKARIAGIETVMITGDNEKTAQAIGMEAGLLTEGDRILLGSDLKKYSDEELLTLLPKVKIFARTTPFDKERIVLLFQKLGHIVAVTGDGVNDAIALKRADVGIAMGLIGTDVARETADIVLADDNFASIINAVEEGRNILKKLKNAVSYLFSTNLSEVIALVSGLILGITEIFTAIQILFVNLIGDGLPALALAFSPKDETVMQGRQKKDTHIVSSYERMFIVIVGVVAALFILIGYYLFSTESTLIGKTVAFAVLAMTQSFILIELWVSHGSVLKKLETFASPVFILAFLIPIGSTFAIVQIPFLAEVFGVALLPAGIFIRAFLISAVVLVTVKFVKISFLRNTAIE